ncbi:uncharacterized protein HGUI_02813 [Hanseniaspora guilliermondii]|uniref:Uncharacterized protein n=1 Tax=Hanseniaspora guilliermondii TaxID=56406 RepID=A0A1L0CNW8_9ASCO|nr:uncharacterized protein HGUI_02813 [Hanseniaspora guilliermondii]
MSGIKNINQSQVSPNKPNEHSLLNPPNSVTKLNTHGLLLNKIVFNPPTDEDHYREVDEEQIVINPRRHENSNVISNQPIANTETYKKSNKDDYVINDDLENVSMVKDDEFTADQKFGPIIKMNKTGKLKFFNNLQHVQPSLVPAASITGKVQFKPLNKQDNDLSVMNEEHEHVLTGPTNEENNNKLKRKISILDDDDTNHSIKLKSSLQNFDLDFDMSDSDNYDSANNSNQGIAQILQSKLNQQSNNDPVEEYKDDFGQLSHPGNNSIEMIRGDDDSKFEYILSPEKRPNSKTASPKNKIDSPLREISINLSDTSSTRSHKKLKTFQNNKVSSALGSRLDRNSSKLLRLSPAGPSNKISDKENQPKIIPSSPSIQSSRNKIKSLPKLPQTNLNSSLMGSPSFLLENQGASPTRNSSQSKNISISHYLNNQKNNLNNLMKVLNNMQNDANLLENVSHDTNGVDRTKYENMKRMYFMEKNEKERLLSENDDITSKLKLLEDKLMEVRKKEEKLEAQIMQNNERDLENINKYTELKQTTDKKILELEKENEHMKDKLDMIEAQNSKEINELREENNNLLQSIKEKELEINEFKQKTKNFDMTLEKEMSKMNTDLYEQYSKKHEEKMKQVKLNYSEAMNSLKKVVQQLRSDVSKKNEEINRLKQQQMSTNQLGTRRGYK